MKDKKIIIFASGGGSNAENIYDFFERDPDSNVTITAIFTNNPNAYVIERADKLNIPCVVFNREEFKDGTVLKKMQSFNADLIVLAGFLWLIPKSFVEAYPNKIINIHPALLPKFGGKGMYGDHVHQAVVESSESESGITIHYVNENYDEGNIIFQATCPIDQNDDAGSVASKIHKLEYQHFPEVIKKLLRD